MESIVRSHYRLVEQARRSPHFHRVPTVLTGGAPFATLDARASLATVCPRSVSRALPILSLESDPSFSLHPSASLEQYSARAMTIDSLHDSCLISSIWILPLAFVEKSFLPKSPTSFLHCSRRRNNGWLDGKGKKVEREHHHLPPLNYSPMINIFTYK